MTRLGADGGQKGVPRLLQWTQINGQTVELIKAERILKINIRSDQSQ